MIKNISRKFLFISFLFFFSNFIFAQNGINQESKKGKIVIVVLDVSGSIKKEFPFITEVLDTTLIQNRLEVGDYFVLIPFGDSALPVYSGQLLREEDKKSISNTLHSMKADNNFTDIGSALKEALKYIVDLNEQDFNLYEPLVLFITDGDITTDSKSEFSGKNVSEIFNDSLIGNLPLYNGWYFVGIGKNLHDLPKIAELSGRSDYLLKIEDVSDLANKLDEWIKNIPPSMPLEQGEILIQNVKFDSKKIEPEKNNSISNDFKNIEFELFSTYKNTSCNFEIEEANAFFQSEDKKNVVPLKIYFESGVIKISPLQKKSTKSTFDLEKELIGRGSIKFHIDAKINGFPETYDFSYDVNFKTKTQIFFESIIIPVIFLVALFILIFAVILIQKFRPIKINMIVSGHVSKKEKPLSLGYKKKLDFGSRPSCRFKLDSENFGDVVGQIYRNGINSFQIIIRDKTAFDCETSKNINYKLGESLKLKTKNGSDFFIKFKRK